MYSRPVILSLLLAAGVAAQTEPSSEALLGRIRQKVGQNLARLPNYTCTQTIERVQRHVSKRDFAPVDTLRLEIAYVGGKELVAWPGASKFEEKRIEDVVGRAGAIGSGSFALHAYNVFRTSAPVFSTPVEEEREGRKLFRGSFRVDRVRSSWSVGNGAKSAIVGYHGTFWANAETLDLVRLELQADNIPPQVGISRDSETVEYGRIRIGTSDFLLPLSAELSMVDGVGTASRNRTRFTSCRQYTGESVISFADPAALPEAPKAPEVLRLPAGEWIEVNLAAAIDAGKVAIGDPVSGTVLHDLRKGAAVLIPKGAVLSGRITRMEKREAVFGAFYIAGIQFASIAAGNDRADFLGVLEETGFGGNQYYVPFASDPSRGPSIWSHLEGTMPAPLPGEGIFLAKEGKSPFPAGLRMRWRILPQK
jgi:hypothetical protein